MLQIRQEQMEVLEQAVLRNFERRAMRHLQESFPKHARFMGEAGLQKVVGHGLERARAHGLVSERGQLLYLDLMLLVGSDFDQDPQLRWAGEVLADQAAAEGDRVARLHAAATAYLERVVGPNGEYIDRALQKLRQTPVEGFVTSGGGDFETYMRARLEAIYPEKCAHLGEDGVRALVRQGVVCARSHGLTTERGVVTAILLMLFLGSGFATDPQFPWAAAAIKDPAAAEPSARAERLYAAAKDYLQRWLA